LNQNLIIQAIKSDEQYLVPRTYVLRIGQVQSAYTGSIATLPLVLSLPAGKCCFV